MRAPDQAGVAVRGPDRPPVAAGVAAEQPAVRCGRYQPQRPQPGASRGSRNQGSRSSRSSPPDRSVASRRPPGSSGPVRPVDVAAGCQPTRGPAAGRWAAQVAHLMARPPAPEAAGGGPATAACSAASGKSVHGGSRRPSTTSDSCGTAGTPGTVSSRRTRATLRSGPPNGQPVPVSPPVSGCRYPSRSSAAARSTSAGSVPGSSTTHASIRTWWKRGAAATTRTPIGATVAVR